MTYGTETAIRAAHNQELTEHTANPGYGAWTGPYPAEHIARYDLPEDEYVLAVIAYPDGYGAIRYENAHEASAEASQVSMYHDVLSVALFTSGDLSAPAAILVNGELIA